MYDPEDRKSVELYSSAVTLSDMEVFIFPELMQALVLANIMSPLPWTWRTHEWFSGSGKKTAYRRVLRVKQFIMDQFSFNLDLDTWGLTTRQRELDRFSDFVDAEILRRSNALFGYEGDKYYFDMDIRRHFGLDKYTSDVIPYWKTETLEAMRAFRFKEGYPRGAGECVSLSTLYAAALFVVGGIPLSDIYLMATPLHSQDYVDVGEGILTNNRRVVTKTMWFNGTELSAKAQRALRNERVTIVANTEGYVHTLYPEATMPRATYEAFEKKLRSYLATEIDFEILANFLRQNARLQPCFQFSHRCCGKPRFIEAEKVFHYEHGGKFRASDHTRTNLLHEIDEDEFYTEPMADRVLLDELEEFFKNNPVSVDSPLNIRRLSEHLHHRCYNVEEVVEDLLSFCRTEPRLPGEGKQWVPGRPIEIDGLDSREGVRAYLESVRGDIPVADLAFTAYRDMRRVPWKPFLKAALERNPVSAEGAAAMEIAEVFRMLHAMPAESIYDGSRMAQPDEVWNFGRGDGLEKAVCLMNIIRNRRPGHECRLEGERGTVRLRMEHGREFVFETRKRVALPNPDDFRF